MKAPAINKKWGNVFCFFLLFHNSSKENPSTEEYIDVVACCLWMENVSL